MMPQIQQETRTIRDEDDGAQFKTLRYEDSEHGKPPIPVTVAPPRAPPTDTHPAFRDAARSLAGEEDSAKRDSGLAPTTSTGARDSDGSVAASDEGNRPLSAAPPSTSSGTRPAMTPVLGKMVKSGSWTSATLSLGKKPNGLAALQIERARTPKTPDSTTGTVASPTTHETYSPLTTPIPSDDQLEMNFMDQVTFSNRGSVLLGGKKAVEEEKRLTAFTMRSPMKKSASMHPASEMKSLDPELELQSQKVRSMYETDSTLRWENGSPSIAEHEQLRNSKSQGNLHYNCTSSRLTSLSSVGSPPSLISESGGSSNIAPKNEHELAGGLEDWQDVQGGDVDRYGFITLKKEPSRAGTPEPRPPVRTSTVLQLASDSPRKKRGFGRAASSAASSRSLSTPQRSPSRKISTRSLKTQMTSGSQRSPSKPFRAARNRLPGNQDRRLMDEAGDMLTLPPGLADIAEHEEGGRAATIANAKEVTRTEKWRKMARIVKNEGGMVFEFDSKNSKLIERTWKGIPDRWRATAWHSFLSASAKQVKDSPKESDIIADFHSLLQQSSPDDVQIDMDVPRTINSHIMFRRRYRGGQRLLFRVLHSLSLYFPDTGYVQGMASIAATLLCYYDEDRCFVMLVRMWTLRSLDKLYAPGFAGLMSALGEFQTKWMAGNDISMRLDELSIDPTAYGTRWYLTLFNYSIPFPAQLRVWDVFMLLGDADLRVKSLATPAETQFKGGLDVIHAASAALIDGTRDILLDSDFENSMKVLTSWVPIKDEELFMKVTKAEWKLKRGRRR